MYMYVHVCAVLHIHCTICAGHRTFPVVTNMHISHMYHAHGSEQNHTHTHTHTHTYARTHTTKKSDSRVGLCSSIPLFLQTHIPTHTMASTTMIMKNTAATATTTYSHREVASSLVEAVVVLTLGSVGDGVESECVGGVVEEEGRGGEEEEGRGGDVVETSGVEEEGRIWEEVAGGASQTRDIGMEFSSVITAHFSLTFGRKTCPLVHPPSRARSTSRKSRSPRSKGLLGIYSSSPNMLHVYTPA